MPQKWVQPTHLPLVKGSGCFFVSTDPSQTSRAVLEGEKRDKGLQRQQKRTFTRSLLRGHDMGKTQNTETEDEQWLAVGGGWQLVAVGSWWRLVALAVGGWWFLGAVLKNPKSGLSSTTKELGFSRTPLHKLKKKTPHLISPPSLSHGVVAPLPVPTERGWQKARHSPSAPNGARGPSPAHTHGRHVHSREVKHGQAHGHPLDGAARRGGLCRAQPAQQPRPVVGVQLHALRQVQAQVQVVVCT